MKNTLSSADEIRNSLNEGLKTAKKMMVGKLITDLGRVSANEVALYLDYDMKVIIGTNSIENGMQTVYFEIFERITHE